MSEEKDCCSEGSKGRKAMNNSSAGFLYCMGFIGAVIYFIQHATSFWGGVLGVLKAIIWPLLVTYKVLGFLGL